MPERQGYIRSNECAAIQAIALLKKLDLEEKRRPIPPEHELVLWATSHFRKLENKKYLP